MGVFNNRIIPNGSMSGKLTKNHAKYIKSLQQKKFREEYGVFVVEGTKLLNEILEGKFEVETIVVTSRWLQSFHYPTDNFMLASEKEMAAISSLKKPPGCLAVVKRNYNLEPLDYSKSLVVLEGLNDPGNLGTILRLCDWFGITQVGLLGEVVDPYNPKVVQATMGSLLRVQIHLLTIDDLNTILESEMYVVRADLRGKSVYEVNIARPFALFMGSESNGFSEEVSERINEVVTIPRIGSGESLNVGVSTGIIISEFMRKLRS